MVTSFGGRVCGFLGLPCKGGSIGLGSLSYPAFRARLSSHATCTSGSLSVRSSRAYALSSTSATVEQQGWESKEQKKLVLYSKQGCCLCDGLKEKLQQVAALGRDGPLDGQGHYN
eukprot:TRINITY_DN8832_c0_g1_i1.p1 TRINITY_DN8832_c0_g1~~TRINITY_DN8832_c0_g1_i1.p1  ORF type:complete len:128 (-),score=14.82 TRINITY_DN8832_c0_g1_i1:331-675(-)